MLTAHKRGVVAQVAFCAAVAFSTWTLSSGACFAQGQFANLCEGKLGRADDRTKLSAVRDCHGGQPYINYKLK
jgi:hypothetical protein